MVFIEITVVPVTLPTLMRALNLSELGLQWVVNAYTLALSALLLAGGKCADIFGKRRMFCAGLATFALSSALCGMSPNSWWMIAGRVLQGAGGALMLPATMSIILDTFHHEERGRALGIYVSIGSFFLAIGPFLGGVITQYLSWRYVFWINLPIATFGYIMALNLIPKSVKHKEPFDVKGFTLLSAGIFATVFAIMQAQEWGILSPKTLLIFFSGLSLIAYLIYKEKRVEKPLLDFSLFKYRSFTVTGICIFLNQMMIMVTVFWTIYFQTALGFSPAKAGIYSFFSNIPNLFAGLLAGHIVDKYGPRIPIALGFFISLFSFTWFVFHTGSPSLISLLPALIPLGFGITFVFTPSFVAMMRDVPPQKRGVATGINSTLRQTSASIGLAIFGSLFFSLQESSFSKQLNGLPLPKHVDPNQFDGLLEHSQLSINTLQQLPIDLVSQIKTIFLQSYLHAFSNINLVAALIAVVGLGTAYFSMKSKST